MEERLRQLETELDAVRQELQEAREKQRAGDESFRRFSESGILGIALFDLFGTILFANDAFLRMTGCPLSDVSEGNCHWKQITPPESVESLAHALDALKARGGCDPFEAEFMRRDGIRFWGLFTGVPVSGENVAAFLLDVTERKRAEIALREYAEELKRADHAKDLFLAMLGHELRTPLSTLTATLQVLQRQSEGFPEVSRLHGRMARQIERMGRLVDDIQDVTRIVRGMLSLHGEPLDLVPLVRETVEDQRGGLEGRELTLRCELPEQPLPTWGDQTRLVQLLVNLLNNAGKFTDAGGQVVVRLTRNGDRAGIEVSDSGIGIEAAILPHLFDSFTQAEDSLHRSRGGLGLGLALVKGIAELHGGTVRAASPGPARGASFTVELPLRSVEYSEPPAMPDAAESDDGVHASYRDLHSHCRGRL